VDFNLDEKFDNILIDYFKSHHEEWLDLKNVYDFTDNVKQYLAYISKAKKFKI